MNYDNLNNIDIVNLYKANKWDIEKFNLLVIRKSLNINDKFEDLCYHWYYKNDEWVIVKNACTSKPGKTYSMLKLLSPKGVACIVPGFYKDVYQLGLHHQESTHQCLRQCDDIKYWRDKDMNNTINPNSTIEESISYTNVHRASANSDVTNIVGGYSAGCIVYKVKSAHEKMIKDFKLYGNKKCSLALVHAF